jgi:hypothetical protein
MDTHDVELHNVDYRGNKPEEPFLYRIPKDVRDEVNEGARARMKRPTGAEIRFVADGAVSITLSCPDGSATAIPFWGMFQGHEPVTIGQTPEAVSIAPPDWLTRDVPSIFADCQFSPQVCRLRFDCDAAGPVRYHGITGDIRPPTDDEVPDTRYLAYGTSITEGFRSIAPHLSYPAQTARQAGFDVLNLGSGGSAYCETHLTDYFAERCDWDIATLEISLNMLNDGFSVSEFRDRASYMIGTLAATGRPVVAITLFPFRRDLLDLVQEDPPPAPAQYRDALENLVSTAPANVHLLEGPALLDAPVGLSEDLVHPGDNGMRTIGANLAPILQSLR